MSFNIIIMIAMFIVLAAVLNIVATSMGINCYNTNQGPSTFGDNKNFLICNIFCAIILLLCGCSLVYVYTESI